MERSEQRLGQIRAWSGRIMSPAEAKTPPCSLSAASDIIKEDVWSSTVHPLTVFASDIFSQISWRARQRLLRNPFLASRAM